MVYINELREGDMVSAVYFCKAKNVCKTKAGKTYYSLYLQDKTGVLDSKVWDLNNGIAHFEAMDYIHVDGQVTSFNGGLQLNVKRVRIAQEGEYASSDYMPCSRYNIDEMFNEILQIIETINNPYMKTLMQRFFVEDENFIKKFKYHSAAKSIHHAFVGGLLEHSLSVGKLGDFYSNHYPKLNRDLLVPVCIMHDIGKVNEIAAFPENDYTDVGQLHGHIYIGATMIAEKIKTIDGFPKQLADEVIHCILAHHGELEYGSPKKPALMEALALHFADNLDAKMETYTELLDSNTEGKEWLGFNKLFESNLRVTDI